MQAKCILHNIYILYTAKLLSGKLSRLVYANDHSWENVHGCLTPSCYVLHETYVYRIILIECKIAKTVTVFHSKVLPYKLFNFYFAEICVTSNETKLLLNWNT